MTGLRSVNRVDLVTTTALGGCAPIEVVVCSHSNIALALRQHFNEICSKSRHAR
jgi:hypothetical protein